MPASKANQRAVNKYKKNNYDRIEITVPKGQRGVFQAYAEAHNESVNGFITRAIHEAIARDTAGGPQEAPTVQTETGGITLPPNTLKAAQEAAEAAGEAVPEFVTRAVSETAERDRLSRDS